MAKTKTSTAVKNRYNAKAYDRVGLMLPKGRKADVEAYVIKNGESVNGYVNRLMREDMGISDEDWKRPAETDDDMLIAAANVTEPILGPSDALEAEGE